MRVIPYVRYAVYDLFWAAYMRKNESLHEAIHTTTENKIGWGNPEYDVRMVFSESTGVICMARKCQKAKYQRKKPNISLSYFGIIPFCIIQGYLSTRMHN